MCYPAPGPRCSASLKESLSSSLAKMQSHEARIVAMQTEDGSPDDIQRERNALDAVTIQHQKLLREWESTPEGRQDLYDRYKEAEEEGDQEMAREYAERYHEAKTAYEEKLYLAKKFATHKKTVKQVESALRKIPDNQGISIYENKDLGTCSVIITSSHHDPQEVKNYLEESGSPQVDVESYVPPVSSKRLRKTLATTHDSLPTEQNVVSETTYGDPDMISNVYGTENW